METNQKKTSINLLIKLGQQKAEAQKTNSSTGVFSGNKSASKFPRPSSDRRNHFNSGRNGQGKPT